MRNPNSEIRSPRDLLSPAGRRVLARTGILAIAMGALLSLLSSLGAPPGLTVVTIAAFLAVLAGHALPGLGSKARAVVYAFVPASVFAVCLLAVLAPHSLRRTSPTPAPAFVLLPALVDPERPVSTDDPLPEPSADSVQITITGPTDGDRVDHEAMVTGTVSDPTLSVFVIVATYGDNAYWVQHQAEVRSWTADDGTGKTIGRWFSPVVFGRGTAQDDGKRFAVTAVATRNPRLLQPGEVLVDPVAPGVPRADRIVVSRS